jgi:hypothetical protein
MKGYRYLLATIACVVTLSTGCERRAESLNSTTAASQQMINSKKIDVAEWTEEVLLHDGRTVIVWRRVRAYAGGFPNASRGRDIDTELRFQAAGAAWKNEQSNASLRDPISLEIFDGVTYLVLYVGDRSSCRGKSPKQYLAEVIKWADGKWVEIPFSTFPSDKALMNLNTGYWGHSANEDAKGLIPWKGKHTSGDDGETVKSFYERHHRTCETYQKS